MVQTGNPNSVSDAGVGALCARTAVQGAFLNVKINAKGLDDKENADDILAEASAIDARAEILTEEILAMVEERIQ